MSGRDESSHPPAFIHKSRFRLVQKILCSPQPQARRAAVTGSGSPQVSPGNRGATARSAARVRGPSGSSVGRPRQPSPAVAQRSPAGRAPRRPTARTRRAGRPLKHPTRPHPRQGVLPAPAAGPGRCRGLAGVRWSRNARAIRGTRARRPRRGPRRAPATARSPGPPARSADAARGRPRSGPGCRRPGRRRRTGRR